jgi:hypothetical protein
MLNFALTEFSEVGIALLCRGPAYNQRTDLPGVLSWVRSFP